MADAGGAWHASGMLDALVSGLLAGYGVAIPVGAVAVLVASLAARTSLVVGSAAALGVATADGLYALVAVLGGAALARIVAPVARPLSWLAALVLAVLAVRVAVAAWRRHREPARATFAPLAGATAGQRTAAAQPAAATAGPRSTAAGGSAGLTTPPRAFAGLLGVTLLNPATVVYFAALVLGRRSGAPLGAAASGAFVVAAFLASASWQLLIAAGGSVLGRALTGPRGRLGTALVSSMVILALAVRLVLTD